jgi:hypothetical protein
VSVRKNRQFGFELSGAAGRFLDRAIVNVGPIASINDEGGEPVLVGIAEGEPSWEVVLCLNKIMHVLRNDQAY